MKNLLLFLIPFMLIADIPKTISWQGVLTDSEDILLDGTYDITVKIFDAYSEGTELWSETHTDLQIKEGFANIMLGSENPLNLDFDEQYWLEIIIGEGEPLTRLSLNSVPYSFYSDKTNSTFVGDSLVLKDTTGEARFIFNPDSGTFKMMHNDTVWYDLKVNSPPKTTKIPAKGKVVIEDGLTTFHYKDGVLRQEKFYDPCNIDNKTIEIEKQFDENGTLEIEYEEESEMWTDGFGVDHRTDISKTTVYNEDGSPKSLDYFKYVDGELVEHYIKEDGEIIEETNVEEDDDSAQKTKSTTTKKYDEGVQTFYENHFSSNTYDLEGNKTSDLHSTTTKRYIRGNEYYQESKESNTTIINDETGMVTEKTERTYYPSDDEYTFTEYKSNGNTTYEKVEKNGKTYETKSYTDNSVTKKTKTEYYNYSGDKAYEFEEEYDKSSKSRVTRIKDSDGNESSLEQTAKEFNFSGEIASNGPKKFKINHPEDNTKYLQHAAVESNEVLNQYSGNVTTDGTGMATVTLPDYFDDVNTDFRYQLTVIGTTFAQAIIYSEISDNEFTIKTDESNVKVSWQITAKRNDSFMQDNPFEDEPDK